LKLTPNKKKRGHKHARDHKNTEEVTYRATSRD
jgi:hypothetical protein